MASIWRVEKQNPMKKPTNPTKSVNKPLLKHDKIFKSCHSDYKKSLDLKGKTQ